MVKDLNGFSKEDFINELSGSFIIENKHKQPFQPSEKHQFGMYLDNDFYSLVLQKDNEVFETALESLDTQILYKKVLLPLLGIEDLRNDERIERCAELHESGHGACDRKHRRAKVGDEVEHACGGAPYARLLHSQRFKRKPCADGDQDIRPQRREQVTLNLHIDLLEDAHGVFLARQRRPDQLYQLAPEVLARGQ